MLTGVYVPTPGCWAITGDYDGVRDPMGFHSPNLLEDGYEIRTIQELLGHKDVATTMIYTHVLNLGGKASGVRRTHSEPRRFGFIRIRIKPRGRVRHSTIC